MVFSLFQALNTFSQNRTVSVILVHPEQTNLNGSYLVSDSTDQLIGGSGFSTNSFDWEVTTNVTYRLFISVDGFSEIDTNLFVSDTTTLFTFQLAEITNAIDEVTITAKRPTFEKTVDGTRVNVENSLLSKSNNAQELLGRIPTVSVSGNKVTVFGRGDALIILNGKETTFESYKSLPPSDIKNIEVITNPDAKYDGKAKAVILVTMKKHYSQGLSATLVESLTAALVKDKAVNQYLLNAPNATINFRKNKWDFSAYYANELGTTWAENTFITGVKAANGLYRKIGYYTEDSHSKSIHYYRFGVGYKLTERSSISAQYDGLHHKFGLDVAQNGDYYSPDNTLTPIRMVNDASTMLLNHSANINYNLKTDTLGSNLFIGAQFNQFENSLLDRITETIGTDVTATSNNRINDGFNQIRLAAFQADYTRKTKRGSFDFGGKFAHTTNEGQIRFYSKNSSESQYQENEAFSNSTVYTEYAPALYAIYKLTHKKWTTSIGLRWEHTTAKGISKKMNSVLIDTVYMNFFPSAKAFYKLNNNWRIGVTYSHKINRPLYQDLDPFLWYLDSLTSIQGNSRLIPELLHQSELKVIYKQCALRYGFTLSNSTITSIMKQGIAGINSVVFTKDNIQQRTLHTIAFDVPLERNNYSGFNILALNAMQYHDKRAMYQALKSSPQLYLYSYHSYAIPRWFTVELTAEYYGASFDGFTKRKPYYYLTFGLSKSFLNETLNATIMWNDFARTALFAGTFEVNTFSNNYSQRFSSDYLRFSLTYNLTSKTTFQYMNKNVNDAEFNRIKK